MTKRRVLFCTSFEADVHIQLPMMRWFRERGDDVAVLSLRLNYGYDPGRPVLDAAGFAYRVLEENDLPYGSAGVDGYGKHFVASRLVDEPVVRAELDPQLCALVRRRIELFRRRKGEFEQRRAHWDWRKLCGWEPDAVFLCSSLPRYFWVVESARRDGIPTFNYWHGLMHPPTFRTPHEYWWVNHPIVWGENQFAGYAGCGCPPAKIRAQSPARFIRIDDRRPRPGLMPATRPTVLINGQSCDPSTPFWAFSSPGRVVTWLEDIASALAGLDVNVVYKEHPRNQRRFEADVGRVFAALPARRFVLNEASWDDLAAEADAAIMLASSTALDLLLAGVPLICYEPFEYEIAGWRWHRGITDYGAATAVERAEDLRPAILAALARGRGRRSDDGGPDPRDRLLAPLLANRTAEGFERFMQRNVRLIGSAQLRRAVRNAARPGPDAPILLLNDTEANNHAGCALTMRGLKGLIAGRFPRRQVTCWPVRKTWAFPHSPRSIGEMERLLASNDPAVVELRDAVRAAARVVVNGEGTFFGARNETFALLFFAYAAASLGRPCAMVNNSFSIAGMSEEEADLCRVVLSGIDDFAVRDSFNFNLLRDAGYPCRLAADALYLGAWPRLEALQSRRDGARTNVLISGSALYSAAPDEVEAAVRLQSELLVRAFPPGAHRYLVLARGSLEERVLASVAGRSGVELTPQARVGADELIDFVFDCRVVVSGRYHYNMLAGLAGVPFIPLDSNNTKMRGLCDDLRYPLRPLSYGTDGAGAFEESLAYVRAREAALRDLLVATRERLMSRAQWALAPWWRDRE